MREIDKIGVFARVNRKIDELGGGAAVGRRLGVSRQHISAMLNGRRPMSPALLALAGVRHVYVVADGAETPVSSTRQRVAAA